MTDSQKYDELRRNPFWQVQSVFDPDRGGHDFAYTIGLHERGLPELHLWARPTLGEDPGLDWVFSVRDRTMVLNELATKLVTGAIGVGSEICEEYDNGEAIVRYRVDPPGDREELEAYGIAHGAEVLPVRWSLERAAEGDLVGLGPAARAVARRETVFLAATLKAGATSAPRGWTIPKLEAKVDFSPDQRYGPLTPLVRARAAQFWQADDDKLATMLELALVVEFAASLTHPVSMAIAAARPVGRRRQLEVLSDDVRGLVDWLVDRPAAQRRWRSIIKVAVPDAGGSSASERRRFERSCAGVLHDLVLACLMIDAVSDVVDREVLIAARGPWVFATSDADDVENPDWWAPDEVLSIVERLLRPHDGPTLGHICVAHQAAGQEEAYARIATRLMGWAVTSAAACPWDPVLSQLPAWDPFVAKVEEQHGAGSGVDVKIAPLHPLHRWADCLTSALTHARRLSSDDISTFVAPVCDLLPELASILETRAGHSAHDAA